MENKGVPMLSTPLFLYVDDFNKPLVYSANKFFFDFPFFILPNLH